MQTAQDPLTGESFTKTRHNQVFANRENQIRYNNLKAREKRQMMNNINKILETNRSVLKKVLGKESSVVKSQDFLLGAGFHFGCSTHTIKREGVKWSCIYDYGYRLIEEKQFKIISLQR